MPMLFLAKTTSELGFHLASMLDAKRRLYEKEAGIGKELRVIVYICQLQKITIHSLK